MDKVKLEIEITNEQEPSRYKRSTTMVDIAYFEACNMANLIVPMVNLAASQHRTQNMHKPDSGDVVTLAYRSGGVIVSAKQLSNGQTFFLAPTKWVECSPYNASTRYVGEPQ